MGLDDDKYSIRNMVSKDVANAIKSYCVMDRFDILYANPINMPIFPCKKCGKESCKGLRKCKGYGAYSLCIRVNHK